jgi:hypothetical protein
MNTPITDPAVLEACRFLRPYYEGLGALRPEPHSVEEQHAITVLAAYVRQRGEPVAWRYRYLYPGGPGAWRVKQTEVKPQKATGEYAAVEVEPLYAGVAGA